MKNHYDDKLAEKFRQTLENYEVAFDSNDWDDMRKRLPLPVHQTLYRRLSVIAAGAAMLAASVLTVLYLDPSAGTLREGSANTAQRNTSSQQDGVQVAAMPSHISRGGQKEEQLAVNQQENQSTLARQGMKSQSGQSKKNGLRKNRNYNKGVDSYAATGQNRQTTARTTIAQGSFAHSTAEVVAALGTQEDENVSKTVQMAELAFLSLPAPSLLPIDKTSLGIQLASQFESPAKTIARQSARWKFGVAVLPSLDLISYNTKVKTNASFTPGSSREFSRLTDLSVSTGVTAEVRAGKKWWVGSAVTVSKQHLTFGDDELLYLAEESDKAHDNMSPMIESSDRFLTEMDRVVLNVPVTLRYDLNSPENKNQAFVSAGVSNFLYVQETYVYQEQTMYRRLDFLPKSRTATQTVNPRSFTNMEFASTLNVSVGVERHLSNRWSLQAEPFYRMPLRKSGNENLNIHNTGITMRLNYNLM